MRAAVAVIGLVWSGAAGAQALSADVELLEQALSNRSPPGVHGLWHDPRVLRLSWRGQYARNPVVLERETLPELLVVSNRATNQLGAAYDVSPRLGVYGSVPIATQWGSTSARYGADGTGLGDLQAGLRVVWAFAGPLALGTWTGVYLPTGTRDAWLGEDTPRIGGGAVASVKAGPVHVVGNAGARARAPITSDADLRVGSELDLRGGVEWQVQPWFAATGAVAARLGLVSGASGASPAEGWLGARIQAADRLDVDLGAGHGLSAGYGTTDLRVYTALIWRPRLDPPEPEPVAPSLSAADLEVLDLAPPPEPIDPEDFDVDEEPEEPDWAQGQLARIEGTRIEIREQLHFVVGKPELLPRSLPVLAQVARILQDHPEVANLDIVGHASEEGSFGYNFKLSFDRGVAVFSELVSAGVHPDRLAVRGMGEVEPLTDGATEEALAANRRVEFRIARVVGPDEAPPTYGDIDRFPWNGAPRPTEAP